MHRQADILFLFQNGYLVDFTISEIEKLVRSLFSDSELRKKNLELIRKGHPLGLEDGDEEEEDDEFWLDWVDCKNEVD